MAKELNMDSSSCTFSWFHSLSENMGFKEIASDANALTMAAIVDSLREVNIYAKGNTIVASSGGAIVSDKRVGAAGNRMEQNVDIHLNDDDDASFGEIHAQPQSGSIDQGLHGAKGPQGDANAVQNGGKDGGANDTVYDSLQNQVESSGESYDDSGIHDSDNNLSNEKDAYDNDNDPVRDDVPNAKVATTVLEAYGEIEEGIEEEHYDSEELYS